MAQSIAAIVAKQPDTFALHEIDVSAIVDRVACVSDSVTH